MNAIEQVIRGHHRHGLGLANADLEALQVNVTHRALTDGAVVIIPVGLLIIRRKVLDGHAPSGMTLHAVGEGSRHPSADQGILGKILKVAAAPNVPVNVQGRRQPKVHAEFHHLPADYVAAALRQLDVPALCDGGANGNGGTILTLHLRALLRPLIVPKSHQKCRRPWKERRKPLEHLIAQTMCAVFIHPIFLADPNSGRSVRHGKRRDPALLQKARGLAGGSGHHLPGIPDRAKVLLRRIKRADAKEHQLLIRKVM